MSSSDAGSDLRDPLLSATTEARQMHETQLLAKQTIQSRPDPRNVAKISSVGNYAIKNSLLVAKTFCIAISTVHRIAKVPNTKGQRKRW